MTGAAIFLGPFRVGEPESDEGLALTPKPVAADVGTWMADRRKVETAIRRSSQKGVLTENTRSTCILCMLLCNQHICDKLIHHKHVFEGLIVRHDTIRLLDDLAAEDRGYITTADAREKLAISQQSASNLMSRLVENGFLDRVKNGTFVPRPLGALGTRAASEDIALAVGAAFHDKPHRIAYRSALDHHGLLAHPARTVQIASPIRVTYSHLSGRPVKAIREPVETVTIGSEHATANAFVSTLERTLIDGATRPSLIGGWSTLATALNKSSPDAEELTRLSRELGAEGALRRIGSLAEVHNLDRLLGSIPPPPRDGRIIALDPDAPAEEPWTDQRWRVRWPIAAYRAREQTAT